jgi:hypothetical protein
MRRALERRYGRAKQSKRAMQTITLSTKDSKRWQAKSSDGTKCRKDMRSLAREKAASTGQAVDIQTADGESVDLVLPPSGGSSEES